MNLLVVCALVASGQVEQPGEFYQDLRSRAPLRSEFAMAGAFIGKYTVPGIEGLRVTLPAKRENLAPLGLQSNAHVVGDFEITGSYELLSADRPAWPNGIVGVNLFIMEGPEGKRFGRIGRFNTQQDGHVYEVRHTDHHRAEPPHVVRVPTTEKAGQLRVVRRGNRLAYLVKDGSTGDGFKELYTTEFGAGNLSVVRFVVNTGEQAYGVDARLIDLRIRTGDIPEAAESALGSRLIWIGLAVILLLGAVALFWRRTAALKASVEP